MNSNIRLLLWGLFLYNLIISCNSKDEPIKPVVNPSTQNIDSIIVDGYLNKFAFNQKEVANVYLNAKETKQNVKLGIYDVNENLVETIICNIGPQQISTSMPYQNGFGYKVSFSFTVPEKLKSGVYFISKKLPFIIKNSSPKKGDFVIIHPSHNDNAYNNQGGMSLYLPTHQNRARVLSFQRPYMFASNGNPIPFYKWLTTKGYSVDFMCDDEMQDYANLKGYDMLILSGHSEYWTRKARENFDKFVDEGHNALLLTGNTMYWQTRIDTAKQQMICYKYDAYSADPISDIKLKTSRWEDAALDYNPQKSIGLNFLKGGGYNSIYAKDSTGFGGYKIILPDFPIFAGTNLKANDVLISNAIEYDGAKVTFVQDSKLGKMPIYDNSVYKFHKINILGWDYAKPDNGLANGGYQMPRGKYNIGLWIIMKPKSTSGIILNMSSSNYCNLLYIEPKLQIITANSIDFMLKNKDYDLSPILQ